MRSTANGPGKPTHQTAGKMPLKGSRRLGAIAMIGLGLLGVTGCTYIAPQQTTQVYSPSDGIRFEVGEIEFRNILVLSRGAGQEGRIIGAVYNTSGQDAQVTFSGAPGASAQVTVPARGQVMFNQDNPPLELSTVTEPPGALEPMTFTTSLGGRTSENVPVLDGALEEYRPHLPPTTEPAQPSELSPAESAPTESAPAGS